MRWYFFKVLKTPGDYSSEEMFTYECNTEKQARQYADDKAKTYGPKAVVVSFHRMAQY